MSLPNPLPTLVADHRSVVGCVDVPPSTGVRVLTGETEFDATYLVTAADEQAARHLLTRELREVLLRRPLQRLSFAGSRLLLRGFDGAGATDEVDEWLHRCAAEVLAATPGFADHVRGEWKPFPPGICGPLV